MKKSSYVICSGWSRSFLFLILLPFSSVAFATPISMPAGEFTFQNQFEIVQTSTIEFVDRKTSAGEIKFQELKKMNFDCALKANQIYKCYKFMNLEMPQTLKAKILNEFQPQTIVFKAPYAATEMIEENDVYKMWRISQEVLFNDLVFSQYRIFENKDFQSLWLGTTSDKKYLNVRNENLVTESHSYDITKGSKTERYLVYVLFARSNSL